MTWNKRMLTTEDCNSILQHFGKCFIDYFIVDTSLLTTEYSTFAYDFVTITRTTNTIEFNIKNELWTGAYKILDCTSGVTPTVTISGSTITVIGTGLTYVKLELELSPHFKHDTVFEYDYKVKYENPVIVPFYETADLTVQFLDDDTPVSNLSVYDPITETTLTTDNNGKVTVTSDWNKPGDYYYPLQITNNGETVIYNFPYQRLKADLAIKKMRTDNPWSDSVYRAMKNNILFRFYCDNTNVNSIGNTGDFILRYNGKEYESIVRNNNTVDFDVLIGDVDNVEFDLIIRGNHYLSDNNYRFKFDAEYASCDTLTELRGMISEGKYSIIRFTGSGDITPRTRAPIPPVFNSIIVSSDVEIIFENEITMDNTVPLFTVDNANLKLNNLNFDGDGCIVELTEGNVECVNCNVSHVTDTVIRGNGDVELVDCGFVDNNQVLDVEGTVVCSNVLFDLADTTYLDNSKVPFLDVYGDLKLSYCNFNLELTGLDSLGYSYVCCKIGEDYSTNNVSNNKLFVNEAFPVNNNTCSILVESDNYRVTSKSNKAFTWNMINTNTVFSNKLNVEHIGD